MSIECIQVLSMNPHFIARLIQSFLTGYGETCSIQDVSLCIPILYHEPARDKLVKARSDSRFESLFNHKIPLSNDRFLSGPSQLAGFYARYQFLLPKVKQAIIVGCADDILVLCGDHYLRYTKVIRHTDKGLSASVAQWVKAAYYLGILFKKSTPEQISHFLEVDLT